MVWLGSLLKIIPLVNLILLYFNTPLYISSLIIEPWNNIFVEWLYIKFNSQLIKLLFCLKIYVILKKLSIGATCDEYQLSTSANFRLDWVVNFFVKC